MRATSAVARHKAKKAVMKKAKGYYLGHTANTVTPGATSC